MPWYQLDDAKDPKLDELARQYNLHPLHIEDARSADESAKSTPLPNTPSPSSNPSVSSPTLCEVEGPAVVFCSCFF
jgi:hypothetical protein